MELVSKQKYWTRCVVFYYVLYEDTFTSETESVALQLENKRVRTSSVMD
jgi:hypothetical protein